MKIDGQCFCGHVTYEAEINPKHVAICYCTDCQRHSGSAYSVAVAVAPDKFRLTAGTLKSVDRIADSGTRRAMTFCPECGTRIYGMVLDNPAASFTIRIGTVNQRADLEPKSQVWCSSRMPWVKLIEGIPAHARNFVPSASRP